MMKLKYLRMLLLVVLVVNTIDTAFCKPKPVGIEYPTLLTKLNSPNNVFTASIEKGNLDGLICTIKNKKTGDEYKSDKLLPTRINALYWSGDSKTVVFIYLVTGGPQACLIHLKGDNTWVSLDISAPLLGRAQRGGCVVDCSPQESTIRLTYQYKPFYRHEQNTFSHCTMEIDPRKGIVTNISWKAVSDKVIDKWSKNRKYFGDLQK